MLFRVAITQKVNEEGDTRTYETVLPTEVLFARFQCQRCIVIDILEVIND